MSSKTTNRRKVEHIDIINKHADTHCQSGYFDRLRLIHRALPEITLDDIDPSVTFLGKKIAFPLIISSMTGGDHELLRQINRNLAVAAQATHVAMAVGSQRVMFEQPGAKASFALRSLAPDVPMISNLGAVQLNYGFGLTQCKEAVETLSADGLYFHVNALQEAIQPEGNTDFSSLLKKIENINQQLTVPVLIKEVGCGMHFKDIKRCIDAGIGYIDIAGQGGTSWSSIEYHRNPSVTNPGKQFSDWGIPTPVALKMAAPFMNDVHIISSGGLRNALDMVKSVILGARLCGMAGSLLQAAIDSADRVIEEIEALKRAFSIAMFLLGVPNIDCLRGKSQLFLETLF